MASTRPSSGTSTINRGGKRCSNGPDVIEFVAAGYERRINSTDGHRTPLQKKMKIVIIGSGGRLGAALTREYRGKFDVVGFNHAQLDLTNFDQVREKVTALDFDVLINCAAFTNVDLCEAERAQAFASNAEARKHLPDFTPARREKLIH